MEIAWAVSCDSLEWRDDGTVDLSGAGFDTIYVDELPADLEVIVVVRLFLEEGEHGNIEVEARAPDTTVLGSATFTMVADPGPTHQPGYRVSQIEAITIADIPADSPGIYSIELYLEGEREALPLHRRRSIQFNVVEGLPED